MEKIIKESTKRTPEVKVDGKELYIKGRMLNLSGDDEFFGELPAEVQEGKFTKIHLALEYLDTSSKKNLLALLKRLVWTEEELIEAKEVQVICWYCEEDDEDMEDVGNDYERVLHKQYGFEFIETPLF